MIQSECKIVVFYLHRNRDVHSNELLYQVDIVCYNLNIVASLDIVLYVEFSLNNAKLRIALPVGLVKLTLYR